MISVIVPVYNVQPYLRKCLDSIIDQTYKDLEILIIDDGSTDGSGEICDEYKKDERVKVFHTQNRGLSCARNLGLDEAQGEWIGFVDSDDWIESDMYEVLLDRALETGADVAECGVRREKPKFFGYKRFKFSDQVLTGQEAVNALMHHELSSAVWNKLYKKECFEHIWFPENRVFEEIATTFHLLMRAKCVCSISEPYYHYVQRENSLSNQHDMKNLVDYWRANKERYDALIDQVDEEGKSELLRLCAVGAVRAWVYYSCCKVDEREEYKVDVLEMNFFVKQFIPIFGYSGWEIGLRIGVVFPHFFNSLSFHLCYWMNQLHRCFG